MESIIFSSTDFSERSLSVHFNLPFGGSEQASAIILASTSPVHFGGTGGVFLSFLFTASPAFLATSSPCPAVLSMNLVLMLWTAWGVISRALATSTSFITLPSDPSTMRMTLARLISIAEPMPFLTIISRELLCSSVKMISSFLYFPIFRYLPF